MALAVSCRVPDDADVGAVDRPIASGSRSTCTTRASAENSLPWRTVQWFSEAPNASTTSASPSSFMASEEEKPPAIPTEYGLPAKSPCPIALVASTAPTRSPSASSAPRAPARAAPRPATMAGRCEEASRSTTAATEASDGTGGSSGGQ